MPIQRLLDDEALTFVCRNARTTLGTTSERCTQGSDWPVVGRVAGPDALGNRGASRDPETLDLAGRRHAGDDLVDVVDLFVASVGEDVLPRSVLRHG
jgi:hypothetical protein